MTKFPDEWLGRDDYPGFPHPDDWSAVAAMARRWTDVFGQPPEKRELTIPEAFELHGPLLSLSHAARWLGISCARVGQLQVSGRLESVKAEGFNFVPLSAVKARAANPPLNGRPKKTLAKAQ